MGRGARGEGGLGCARAGVVDGTGGSLDDTFGGAEGLPAEAVGVMGARGGGVGEGMAAGLACTPEFGRVSDPFSATNTNTRADAASAAMPAPSKALLLRFLVPAPVSQGGTVPLGALTA